MFHAYIVGQNFMHKEFDTMQQAWDSLCKLQNNPHKEKIMWVISERKLNEKEELMLNVVQTEME